MSEDNEDSNSISEQDQKNKKTKEKNNALVKTSNRKNMFLYDKKCRTILNIGILYKELTASKANSINLTKITDQIQKMIDENEIYLRDVGPIILGVTKIIVKKTNILLVQIQNLTKLRLKTEPQKTNSKKDDIISNDTSSDDTKNKNKNKNVLEPTQIINTNFLNGNLGSYDTNMMNLNSLQSDIMSYKQQTFKKNFNNINIIDEDNENNDLGGLLNNSIKKNLNLTSHKSIMEFGNDDVIRKTIEKMSKKETTNDKILKTEKTKNSKTLKNLQDMLGNNKKNFDSSLRNDFNNIKEKIENQDMTGFFTVLKSEIKDDINDYDIPNENNDIINNNNISKDLNNFKFNFNNIKTNDNNLSLNDTEIIKANIKNNIINDNKKVNNSSLMPKARLKYDDELEYDLETEDTNENEKQKDIEKYENKYLNQLQENLNYLNFDKNKLVSYTDEKYEYLMPDIFNVEKNYDDISENLSELRKNVSASKDDGIQLNNNLNTSSDKRDLTRMERITTSNKKKISLGNFETENNILLQNLSKLSLNREDFQGSFYFDQLKDINKEENNKNNKNNLDVNENEEIMFNNQNIDYNNNENFDNNLEDNKEKYFCDDKKEEEDVELLKSDLEKNVFKGKNKIAFTKIREKIDNKAKFIEPKLFYDLLLLAQKEEIEINQNELMDNSSITISVKN